MDRDSSTKKILIARIQKLIYGWLIFCLGGVGPLTYFDGFMPGHEHGEHPYHWSIFEESTHIHPPLRPQPEALAEQMRFRLLNRLNLQADFIIAVQNLAPGFSRFFASGLSSGYLLTPVSLKIFSLPSLFGSVRPTALTGQSAWLAPPEKPPSVHLS